LRRSVRHGKTGSETDAAALFERAWPVLRAPIESSWRRDVDGECALDQAVREVVAASPVAAL
jgi:hypothetical protein